MNPTTDLTPLGTELINLAHVARVYFTTDLDLKIHFAAMAEPRASMNYAPTSDKPLVLTIRPGTPEYNQAIFLFGLEEQREGLEREAGKAKEAKDREAEKKQGKKGKP